MDKLIKIIYAVSLLVATVVTAALALDYLKLRGYNIPFLKRAEKRCDCGDNCFCETKTPEFDVLDDEAIEF